MNTNIIRRTENMVIMMSSVLWDTKSELLFWRNRSPSFQASSRLISQETVLSITTTVRISNVMTAIISARLQIYFIPYE
jgi:hypothetical protein